jgi:hypothetical protein
MLRFWRSCAVGSDVTTTNVNVRKLTAISTGMLATRRRMMKIAI